MGLLIECPECKRRNSQKEKACKKCGFAMAKFSGRVYWIEYYIDGQRKRERIGPNKAAAEQRLREVLTARTEGRYINKNPETRITFKELTRWYMELAEVKAKRSYDRDILNVKHLINHFGNSLLKDIIPSMVESYKQKRLSELAGRGRKGTTKPATVNRELACLKTIFNKAIKNKKATRNPAHEVKKLKENNERNRILSPEEYIRLLAHCHSYLKPIVKIAYHTAMRRGEILNLTWGQVNLQERIITLEPENTKTQEGRIVPLSKEVLEMFQAMPKGLPMVRVFLYRGKPISTVTRGIAAACQRAGIEDFVFHDLRHTAINNWRLQGHDYFRIMAASGHKTMRVFKRYNTIQREELMKLVEG
jgi:integrase